MVAICSGERSTEPLASWTEKSAGLRRCLPRLEQRVDDRLRHPPFEHDPFQLIEKSFVPNVLRRHVLVENLYIWGSNVMAIEKLLRQSLQFGHDVFGRRLNFLSNKMLGRVPFPSSRKLIDDAFLEFRTLRLKCILEGTLILLRDRFEPGRYLTERVPIAIKDHPSKILDRKRVLVFDPLSFFIEPVIVDLDRFRFPITLDYNLQLANAFQRRPNTVIRPLRSSSATSTSCEGKGICRVVSR
jgi:hypothetical protein